jgi:two-component system sensor histidine kinase RegB
MNAPDVPSLIRADLARHAWWVIYLRYICAAAIVLGAIILTQNMGARLEGEPLYGIAGALVLTNILYGAHLSRAARRTGAASPDAAARSLTLQTGMDLFLLTLLLHFSGGVTNPLATLYVGPVLLAGFLLSVRSAYGLAALALFLYGGMAILEYRLIIPHVPIPGLFAPTAFRNESFLLVALTGLCAAVGMAALISLTVSGRLRGQDADEEESEP